ncbi:MAG: aldo/keto reductase [Christensenellales bacterium]|jgi:predicted aldo/keto reductase-like oxidoreductase
MSNELGYNGKKLGFGLMRLPRVKGGTDLEQTKAMVDLFMKRGFNYFDTAYVYGDGESERITKAALVDRYPRESFWLVDKLPFWEAERPEQMQEYFDESLRRTGAGYFDIYLLHSLNEELYEKTEKLGAWEFVKGLKEQGLIKHFGFSFHDTPEVLDKILTEHPEAEVVQLQINYADWENPAVQSRGCYEVARKHNKPILIMEPVKGSALATLNPEMRKVFKDANPDASVASWAVRFAASLPGVMTVLSGMSNLDQVLDNTSYMADFAPLSEEEYTVINKVVEMLLAVPVIPCTKCRYCVDACPQGIDIPDVFEIYNELLLFDDRPRAERKYRRIEEGRPSTCIACGGCMVHCPQHIEIPDSLRKVTATLGE